MRKVKTRKKSNISIIILLVLVIPLFFSKLQVESADLTSTIKNQKNNYDTLILVNKNNKLSDDYSVDLTTYDNHKVAKVLIDDLKDMYNSALRDNISLEINSSYRTKFEQQKIFDNTISQYVREGNSYNIAVEKTKKLVASPSYSEHETGLAIDFTNSGNYAKRVKIWDWLEANAYKHGFILRYPKRKESITGYDYEAWHYRYVGIESAKIMYENNLCLEEYLNTK